jgi:hypothetical protein
MKILSTSLVIMSSIRENNAVYNSTYKTVQSMNINFVLGMRVQVHTILSFGFPLIMIAFCLIRGYDFKKQQRVIELKEGRAKCHRGNLCSFY